VPLGRLTGGVELNQLGGDLTQNGLADEWVDLESLEQTTTVVALTAGRWIAGD